METGLSKWKDRWTAAGIPTIPLRPYRKAPMCEAWQARASADQWEAVGGTAFRGNIGVCTGQGLAVLDADSERTVEAVERHLTAMGLKPPTVQTASGTGRHYYLMINDAPDGNFTLLSDGVGPGELRWGAGAYVVAPCSLVDDERYRFVAGAPEQITSQKPVPWTDLMWAVADQGPDVLAFDRVPVELTRRDIPRRADVLLTVLGQAEKGQRLGCYPTRSEAEAAVVAMLILAGWDFEEIRQEFETRNPGHFAEHAKPAWYLRYTYQKLLNQIASTPERLELARCWRGARDAAWPGRGGALEKNSYLALVASAWRAGAWTVRASYREIAEHAGASTSGVHGALERLQEAGQIERVQSWQMDGSTAQSTTWRVEAMYNTRTVCHIGEAGGCRGEAALAAGGSEAVAVVGAVGGEIWSELRSRSAGLVYEKLNGDSQSAAALARATGKHRHTVARALAILENHGLAKESGGGWVRGPADLAAVADEVGAVDAARCRRYQHKRERQRFHRRRQELNR
jgi:predicted transcriptional regulator